MTKLNYTNVRLSGPSCPFTVNHVAVCARHLGNLWLPGEPTWTGAERGRHVSDIVGDTVFVFSPPQYIKLQIRFSGAVGFVLNVNL